MMLPQGHDHEGACRHAQDEAAPQGQCGTDIALKWMTEVSSSVYATPIVYDLFSDGHKDIIVPSFVHYLEVEHPGLFRRPNGTADVDRGLVAGSMVQLCAGWGFYWWLS